MDQYRQCWFSQAFFSNKLNGILNSAEKDEFGDLTQVKYFEQPGYNPLGIAYASTFYP